MPRRFRDSVEDQLPDRLPIDVLPVSNEEFIPPDPTPQQTAIMKVAMEDCEAAARRHGVSRRRFLQTGAAYAVCLAAINKVMGTGHGYYAWADEDCVLTAPIGTKGAPTEFPLNYPGAQLNNLPGEFIMDLQTHHIDSGSMNQAINPIEYAFLAAAFNAQSLCGELSPYDCLGRVHYLKELFLDSSTNFTVLSAVPYQPNGQPLPIERSAETAGIVTALAGGVRRTVIHRFVMPNRGSAGDRSDGTLGKATKDAGSYVAPLFLQEELDLMEQSAATYGGPGGHLRAWKIYTPWGDVPYTSGWWLDDPCGIAFIEHAQYLSGKYNMPSLICAHKGFALPTFDQEKAATRDVGIVAKGFPGVSFIIYHSGYDGDSVGLGGPVNQGTSANGDYPGPAAAPSTNRGVDNFITSLVENGWSARHFASGGSPGTAGEDGYGNATAHANVPNVYAELGSVWGSVMSNATRASWLLGKLVYYVGPKRVVWGTDALWGASPQGLIAGLRSFVMSEEAKEAYNLPFGIDGDVDDPTVNAAGTAKSIRNGILGRNAAVPYRVDPDVQLNAIQCDDVQKLRDEYLIAPVEPLVVRNNSVNGPRTRRELLLALKSDPWHRGARKLQNDKGFLKRIG